MKKRSIWHKFAEKDLYEMIEKMGYGEKEFTLFQRKRLIKSLMITLAAIPPGILINKLWFFLAIPAFFYIWYLDYAKAKKEYRGFLFKKQLAFSKFMRLVMPYLKQKHNSIYTVFNKILRRLEKGSDLKAALENLMTEINDKPNSIEPYLAFARYSGGSDSHISFMTMLYDYSQYTSDESVITELGQLASDELFEGIDEIINIKTRSFVFFPTKLTLANFILLAGYMGAIIYNLVTEGLKFS
ncbi:hypothetical protein [Bacillus sp. T9C1]|uniref:hypothetical protein n=1 Tax=Bacillus sp. T9C1 TaxID=2918912 RepID=UPI0022800655|nr:hypothetical protein [Bacillus sp. T9C1]